MPNLTLWKMHKAEQFLEMLVRELHSRVPFKRTPHNFNRSGNTLCGGYVLRKGRGGKEDDDIKTVGGIQVRKMARILSARSSAGILTSRKHPIDMQEFVTVRVPHRT
ncbi:hypothetical protein CBL_01254 [Carabus blaptoides fortunei]